MRKYRFYTVRGTFNWRQIGQVFRGIGTYAGKMKDKEGSTPCGLAKGNVTYRIYVEGFPGHGSAHVCLHSNGVCFSGSLNVECDEKWARKLKGKFSIYAKKKK